jgi:hypothetical protein
VRERRRRQRVLIRRKVDISWEEGRAAGWGRDISIAGLYVQSREQPTPGANVRVTVRLRHGGELSMPGRVCRSDIEGFAVQFLAVGELEADAIRKVVEGA